MFYCVNFLCIFAAMIEFLKHLFGLCGEGHTSILSLLGITPFLIGFWSKIKLFLGGLVSYLRTLLKPLR